MPKILEDWTVLPHGRLTRVDDGIWTVTGELHMPLTPLQRLRRRLGGGKVSREEPPVPPVPMGGGGGERAGGLAP